MYSRLSSIRRDTENKTQVSCRTQQAPPPSSSNTSYHTIPPSSIYLTYLDCNQPTNLKREGWQCMAKSSSYLPPNNKIAKVGLFRTTVSNDFRSVPFHTLVRHLYTNFGFQREGMLHAYDQPVSTFHQPGPGFGGAYMLPAAPDPGLGAAYMLPGPTGLCWS